MNKCLESVVTTEITVVFLHLPLSAFVVLNKSRFGPYRTIGPVYVVNVNKHQLFGRSIISSYAPYCR
jgi:hypothetical protein